MEFRFIDLEKLILLYCNLFIVVTTVLYSVLYSSIKRYFLGKRAMYSVQCTLYSISFCVAMHTSLSRNDSGTLFLQIMEMSEVW